MMRILYLLTVVGSLTVALTELGSGDDRFPGATVRDVKPDPSASTVHKVTVSNSPPFYRPVELQIRAGDTVVWHNEQESGHHMLSDAKGTFQSPPISPGDQWQQEFPFTGTCDYFCKMHPWMRGKITVQLPELQLTMERMPSDCTLQECSVGLKGTLAVLTEKEGCAMLRVRPAGQEWKLVELPLANPLKGGCWLQGEYAYCSDGNGYLFRYDVEQHKWYCGKVMLEEDDRLYQASGSHTAFWVISPAKREARLWEDITDAPRALQVPTNIPTWTLAAASADHVYLMSGSSIWQIASSDGTCQEFALLEGSSIVAMTFAEGSLWYVDGGRSMIGRIRGGWVWEYSIECGRGNVASIAVHRDQVWVLFGSGLVARVTSGKVEQYSVAGKAMLRQLRVGADGQLWFCTDRDVGKLLVANK